MKFDISTLFWIFFVFVSIQPLETGCLEEAEIHSPERKA